MQVKKGIPVSPGVAISRAVVLNADVMAIPTQRVPPGQVTDQLQRLEQALEASRHDIEELSQKAARTVGEDVAGIFNAHLLMLRDAHLVGQFHEVITESCVTAESAVYTVMRRFTDKFRSVEDEYVRERVHDLWDLERRIIRHLVGRTQAELDQIKHDAVVVAHDLTPSQTASLDKRMIKAIATDIGGRTSHTAILAHALGIPAIVGLEDVTAAVAPGDTVIIDGNNGEVIVDPDAARLMEYRQYVRRIAELETSLDELTSLPAETTDGVQITLMANIEFPSEIEPALAKGATGIGLYRTEFLYLASDRAPTEQQQYEAYIEAIDALKGRPLTIRTLDLGADKFHSEGPVEHLERNPFLGCRSIRFCLQNLPLFKAQLRAVLRASTKGPIRLMFPLITSIMELRQAKMILNDVVEDLEEEGISIGEKLPIGIMIEVPSAALQLRTLAQEVDFCSIGTNDLIQYTLAVDRGNERVASLYSGGHPAVLQLIRQIVKVGIDEDLEVSICGEMAGEPEFVMLLVGMGMKVLSITPPAIPEVKKIIRSVSFDRCRKVANRVRSFESEREILNYLRQQARRAAPDAFAPRPTE